MNLWALLYLTLSNLVLLVCSESAVELTDASFDGELANADTALVMFYAPWCGHCKRLKPEFEKAASLLSANEPPVVLAKVDCTDAGKSTCSQFEVRGYPTLKIFKNGELSTEYNGPRESDGIVKYMRSQVGPASTLVNSKEELEQLLQKRSDEVVVVANLGDNKAFLKTADKMRQEVLFAHFKEGSDDTDQGIVLNRPRRLETKLESSKVNFEGDVKDSEEIRKFVKSNYHGVVGHRTPDNARDFKPPLLIAFYDVDYVKNAKGSNYWRNRVIKVAKEHKEVNFAVSNYHDFLNELEEYGLEAVADEKPRVVIRDREGKKFVMEKDFSVENLEEFVQKFENGKLENYVKSEKVPEDNNGPVYVAVARNFDQVVPDDKDALIEFYAPWCGHCKKLAPVYDELGEKLKDESSVRIVKMDATANDVPSGYDVRGFPTIMWKPANGKAEAYQGGREVDDFITFIAEKATQELDGYDRKGKPKKTEL